MTKEPEKPKFEFIKRSDPPKVVKRGPVIWRLTFQLDYPLSKEPAHIRNAVEHGQKAWARLRRSNRQAFEDWLLVMKAVAVGEEKAAQLAGKSEGGRYSRLLSAFLEENKLGDLPKNTRALMHHIRENQLEITDWRLNHLTPEQLDRWNSPKAIWRHFSEWKRRRQQGAKT
jgi:hypothetical protein